MVIGRNRTPSVLLVMPCTFFRIVFKNNLSKTVLTLIKRNHVSIWNWMQKYRPKRLSSRKKRVGESVVDETLLKIGQSWHGFDGSAIEPAD
jgi:putative transposase